MDKDRIIVILREHAPELKPALPICACSDQSRAVKRPLYLMSI
jgi:hypothetical protein